MLYGDEKVYLFVCLFGLGIEWTIFDECILVVNSKYKLDGKTRSTKELLRTCHTIQLQFAGETIGLQRHRSERDIDPCKCLY